MVAPMGLVDLGAGRPFAASGANPKGNMIFNELRLPKFRRTVRHGTPELMPYSHLAAPGITVLKDGSLLRSFRMYGPDLKAADLDQLLAIKHHNNSTLVRFTDGWMVQSDLVRFYTTDYVS